ncbi:MAG: molecular chaperone Tir [Flavobacteriales bacterium]|nr:molecular chaperone Tir [Flavobacteriales bacterium]
MKKKNLIKELLLELEYTITHQTDDLSVFVIDKEVDGIKNLVIAYSEPILIIEQFLFEIKNESLFMYKNLLKKNRDIVHGAFVLDDSGTKVIFRDTLQTENLDKNELEASLNSLSLLLSEYSKEIVEFSKN